jgi:hypothetical protein
MEIINIASFNVNNTQVGLTLYQVMLILRSFK